MNRLGAACLLLLLETLAASASVNVKISSPANNAVVGASAHYVAAATSNHRITGMQIYVDGKKAYATTGSQLNTTIALSVGSHQITVKAWDSTGAVGRASQVINSSNALVPPPPPPNPNPIKPTTTLVAETGNNTSAANSFLGWSNGDIAPTNISKVSIKTLVPWFGGKLLAHYMPWWGASGHKSNGQSSHDPAQAERIVEDMISRGFDGVMVSESNSSSWDQQGALALFAAIENHSGFYFIAGENKGALDSASNKTAKLIADMQFDDQHYFNSPNYLRWNGRPVVVFFDSAANISGVDWAAAKAGSVQYGNPLWIFRNSSGFGYTASDGAFAWIGSASGSDPYGLSYLKGFYSEAMSHTSDLAVGSAWRGFNDSMASWGKGKVISGHCGQTWLASMALATTTFESSSHQIPFLKVNTWNDYEEGTEVETGVDNCGSVSASLSGAALSFAPKFTADGSEKTVDHYTVFISTDGQNLAHLTDLPVGSRVLNVGSFNLASGTYYLYVKMIGKPMITNHMSGRVTYVVK